MARKNYKIRSKEIILFIQNELHKKIIRDLRYHEFKIVSEADLQSVVYYHLRKFLCKDESWRIYNKLYSSRRGRAGVYPDIVLLKCFPKIAIELKEHKSLQKRYVVSDAKKLHRLRERIKYGFIIYLTRQKPQGGSSAFTDRAKEWIPSRYKNIIPIVINAYDEIPVDGWENWEKQWNKFSKLRQRHRQRK